MKVEERRGEERGCLNVCVRRGAAAHELHTKAPTCTLPLHLCPGCQACRAGVRVSATVGVACVRTRMAMCTCEQGRDRLNLYS